MNIRWTNKEHELVKAKYDELKSAHPGDDVESLFSLAQQILPEDRRKRPCKYESQLPWAEKRPAKTSRTRTTTRTSKKTATQSVSRIDTALDNLADVIAEDVETRITDKLMDRLAEKLEKARQRRFNLIRERALAQKALDAE